MQDQRGSRKMYIGNKDIKTTKVLERRQSRMEKINRFHQKQSVEQMCCTSPDTTLTAADAETSDDSACLSDSQQDPDFCTELPLDAPAISTSKIQVKQMRQRLENLATACDRTGVSDRSASIIASAVLQDVGLISEQDTSKVIDRSKLRRERKKNREDLQSSWLASPENIMTGLYFDGRKDKTLVQEKRGDKYHRVTTTEEHIVLISEPESEYIGHVTPPSGTASSIKKSIMEFLNLKFADTSSIVAIGCDGTAVNTGSKNGAIALLERQMNRPLHWFICLLHANELPLRHLFNALDGCTSGPNTYAGVIGKLLQHCEDLPVVEFEKIETVLPEIDANILSTDQKYLLQICVAVTQGSMSTDLANRQPGKLAHSRWLTCANRILRLYVATKSPSESLAELAKFVIKVYAPTWFSIKTKPSCKDGPNHILTMIKRCSYLKDDLKAIAYRIIQRNSFFAHSENILLAMLQDEKQHIKELALRRILKARKTTKGKKVREFVVPELNFEANYYYDLIDWTTEKIFEPPFTSKYSDNEIWDKIMSENIDICIERLPCHTQAVERAIKLVTDASMAVCGTAARDGYIRARIKSRQEMPIFNTKSQFFSEVQRATPNADNTTED